MCVLPNWPKGTKNLAINFASRKSEMYEFSEINCL